MTFSEVINIAQQRLPYAEREAKSIAIRLLQDIEGVTNYAHIIEPERVVLHPDKFLNCFIELEKGRPLQYVLGYEWFYGLKFNVSEGVLIPRPESEELIRMVVSDWSKTREQEQGLNVLDVCTGSGCLAWALAHGLKDKINSVVGCDLSNEALKIAQNQFSTIGAEGFFIERPTFVKQDVLSNDFALNIGVHFTDKLDIIISNPPYVCESEREFMRPNVLEFEPEMALFVPDTDPLIFYEKISLAAKVLLKSNGMLYFEINERFGCDCKKMLAKNGWDNINVIKDINGKDRFVSAKLGEKS